jgi:hypothetical protein
MISKARLIFAATMLAASVASPAFAQSFDHTGSQLANYYDSTGKQVWGGWAPQATAIAHRHLAARRSGLSAYAMTRGVNGSAPSTWGYDPTIARER